MHLNIEYYINCLRNLRRDRKKGGAPHKPILLLSIFQLIDSGYIKSNRIYVTPELVSTFKSNWSRLVVSDYNYMIFSLPYYHMKSEPFWRLKANEGCHKWVEAKSAMKTFANLKEAVDYAEIDYELFVFLKNKTTCNELKIFLLNYYFYETKQNYPDIMRFDDLDEIHNQIFEESPEDYKNRIDELEKKLDKDEYEQEVFLRSSLFKREIDKIYNSTCCISGLRIDATDNISMIDACHIVPFSESHNDSITNGIALCPNLHRAFDRGLIAINDDYRIVINPIFTEPYQSRYSINQFSGKPILLPTNSKYHPHQENLAHHRQRFNFGF